MNEIMIEIKEYLPFLIPLVVVQLILYIITLIHVLKHENYKNGNRILWLIVITVGMNYVGPILYFVFGKEDE